MNLIIGKMNGQQLSNWFGVSLKAYQNSRKKYLQKLQNFCNFDEVRGGVIIKEIYISEYSKTINDDKLVYEEIKQAKDGITTGSGMSRKFQRDYDSLKYLSLDTIRKRVSKASERLLGKNGGDPGPYGSREYVWAIKLSDFNEYRALTFEEDKLFSKLIENAYCGEPEKIKRLALLDAKFKEDESMSKEEYFLEKERLGLDLFSDVLRQFKIETGLIIVHATQNELNECSKCFEETK